MRAQVPIILIGIDYKTKTITADTMITPSGDLDKDMKEIKQYFTQFTGRNPENFVI